MDSTGKTFTLTDFYFGLGGLVDIFRKDAKDHFWAFYKKQMNIGIEGWWGDLGEPEKHPAGLYHNLVILVINDCSGPMKCIIFMGIAGQNAV